MNDVQIRSAEKALSVGTWLIVAGAMLYSVLTVTPLMTDHTPAEWGWTAPILPLVVDAAVVIVVRLDSVLARLGGQGGRWPIALRWMTGAMTLALNVADSALQGDLVGVAVHSVAPLLLIVTAETGLAYRRAITAAVAALKEEERAEREARRQAAVDREERAERRERERRDHEAQLAREQRDHEARLARERAEHEERDREEAREARERSERERLQREREQQQRDRERRERELAERREQQERERAERERREQIERAERAERERAALLAAGPATEKLSEEQARQVVRAAYSAELPVRAASELTGWSIGWVSSRYSELRQSPVLEGAAV
ncbi:hypothetical protein [Streptomyces katrae]|uniref:hypothetical protein n=1 Tax=Streptomyces katrae TaxID=68223 RepID=UPI0004BF9DFF|nr:hypothetical protein [Streptomyces katrae]